MVPALGAQGFVRASDAIARTPTASLLRGRPTTRIAIIDTQSVKCIGVRGPRDYAAAEKVVGCKRVMMVDAEGHIRAKGRHADQPANAVDAG